MKKIFLLLILFGLSLNFYAQKYFMPVKQATGQVTLPEDRIPSEFLLFKVEKQALINSLLDAPDQFATRNSHIKVQLPLPDGNWETFDVFRTHPMSPELESKVPGTYSFRGINKKGQRVRLDINSSGVFYSVYGLGTSPAVFQIYDNDKTYILYYQHHQNRPEDHVCEVTETVSFEELDNMARSIQAFGDGLIRKYRLAYATTGEFSQYHVQQAINNGTLPSNATDAQKKQAVLNALVVIVNRINEVYEVDAGITLELVPNNLDIIYLDANSDPYSNSSPSSLLSQNQSNLDNVIGNANYDIGHVGSTGGGGLARIRSVCVNSIKAMGETGLPQPVGDEYAIDFAAHEMGHQFGGNHTFANYCGGNRNDGTSVEPGSGTTIMAYAGVCSPNIQQNSDPQFHYVSLAEFWNHITSNTCAQTINANNNAPTVNAGPDRWIPKETPFVLVVTASDADGDSLTYTWDETDIFNDSGQTNAPPQATNTSGPMFRVYPFQNLNIRYFPRMADILNGNYGNTWEVLPSVNRILTFNVVVRDMVAPGGQIAHDQIALGIDASTGPFRVTSHSNDETWNPGDTKTITWNVAGTTGGNVNAATVDILLSLDGGQTFTVALATNTPNDGSETITVPNVASPNAYYMVIGHDNYFFDVNKGKLTIGNYQEVCQNYSVSPSVSIPDNNAGGVSSTIQVNDSFTISDLNLSLDISHTYINDLRIKLTSPQGTEVYVFDRGCGNQDNIVVTFDDEASSTMDCSNMASGNTYQPANPLSAFDGENTQGTWTLTVSDHYSQDTGTLNSWSLNICEMQLGISDNPVENLKIYPIPASEFIHVAFDAHASEQQIIITDINGREIFERSYYQNGPTDLKINVSNWSKGIYLFKVIDGKAETVQKVIIK